MALLRQSKLLRSLFSLYLILVFFVVVPFHHHADQLGHPNTCVVCALNHLPLLVTHTIQLALFLLTFSFIISGEVAIKNTRQEYLHLRSPPAF